MNKELISIRSSYKAYRQQGGKLNYKEYNKSVSNYLKYCADLLLNSGQVILPYFGKIEIKGKKPKISFEGDKIKGLRVDFVKTKKLGKTVYFTNEHTSGIQYSFRWSKYKVKSKFKTAYSLKITKPNRRKLYELVTKHNKEYQIIS
jgi:nucleoid DNA-binding protein